MLIFIRFFLANKPDRGFREVCHDRLYRYVWLHMQRGSCCQTNHLLDHQSIWTEKEIELMMPSKSEECLMLLFAWTWRFVTVYICCDISVCNPYIHSLLFETFILSEVASSQKEQTQIHQDFDIENHFLCAFPSRKKCPNTRSWVGMKHVKSLLVFGSFLGPWNPYQVPTVFSHRWLIRTSHSYSYPSSSQTQAGSFIHPTFS